MIEKTDLTPWRRHGPLWVSGDAPAWALDGIVRVQAILPMFRVREVVFSPDEVVTGNVRTLGRCMAHRAQVVVYAAPAHANRADMAVTVAHEMAHVLFDHGLLYSIWTARICGMILEEATDWKPRWRDRIALRVMQTFDMRAP